LLLLWIWIVPNVKLDMLIKSPPKLPGNSFKSPFVVVLKEPEVNLYSKVELPVGFCKQDNI
jgi:hypothetical protein